MDRSARKFYHLHEFDPKQAHNTYFSAASDSQINEELFMFPIIQLMKISGQIKGDSLIEFSGGSCLFHLLTICDGFKDITILESSDSCIADLKKWMKKEQDAIDWSHASQIVTALEGNSDKWKEKEESLRCRVKNILKCDFEKDNPTDPVILKKVDCVLSLYILDLVSQDHDAFCSNLCKLSCLLKLGGRLLLFGGFNSTFYKVDGTEFHVLSYYEPFVRKALLGAGFTTLDVVKLQSNVKSDIVSYEHIYFINALKVRGN